MQCPDCGAKWPTDSYQCTECGLTVDDLAAAAEYWESLRDDADPGDMDGDHETGLASAGFGTDEDYGVYMDDYDVYPESDYG